MAVAPANTGATADSARITRVFGMTRYEPSTITWFRKTLIVPTVPKLNRLTFSIAPLTGISQDAVAPRRHETVSVAITLLLLSDQNRLKMAHTAAPAATDELVTVPISRMIE